MRNDRSLIHVLFAILAYITSHIFGLIYLTLLFIGAFGTLLFHKILGGGYPKSAETSQSHLSKKERRLVKDLSYYMDLAGCDLRDHDITTDDGFIINLQHLTYHSETSTASFPLDGMGIELRPLSPGNTSTPRRSRSPSPNKTPVLFIHGLMQSSASFCTSGADSLALYMLQQGYDVWLGNNRCGFHPRHERYSERSRNMWDWDVKDMAKYDLPAMVDYICNATGSEKVALVAHSQGTAESFWALAHNQQLAERILCFTALSPAVYAGPLLDRWFLKFIRYLPLTWYHLLFGQHSFLGAMMLASKVLPLKLYTSTGYVMFNYMLGWNDALWNRVYRDREFIFSPVYVSSKLMFWWLGKHDSLAIRGCIFDESKDHWFEPWCPPIALVVPGRDNLVNGQMLVNRLMSYDHGRYLKELQVIDIPEYSHLDVLWAADVIAKVGTPLHRFIEKCSA